MDSKIRNTPRNTGEITNPGDKQIRKSTMGGAGRSSAIILRSRRSTRIRRDLMVFDPQDTWKDLLSRELSAEGRKLLVFPGRENSSMKSLRPLEIRRSAGEQEHSG